MPGLQRARLRAPTWPSLKTTAVLDGDEWVINGQKVWTTQAQYADYCFLLARTDPDAPKHKGISYLLVPMKQDGIEVAADHPARRHRRVQRGVLRRRPLPEGQRRRRAQQRLGGRQHDARLRAGHVGHHRLPPLREGARPHDRRGTANGAIDDPLVRQRLGRYHTKIQILRINGLRSLTATRARDARTRRVAALGATNKMFWSEMHRDAMELALDIIGAGQHAGRHRPGRRRSWPARAAQRAP